MACKKTLLVCFKDKIRRHIYYDRAHCKKELIKELIYDELQSDYLSNTDSETFNNKTSS
jgi:hypothetical protein